MRILFFLLFPIFLSAQINRAYGVIEIGATFPFSSATGPKFAYRPVDSSFYRWVHTNIWVKIVEPSIIPDTLYLQQISGTTAIVNGDTINLTPYVLKTDTTSILAPYIKLAGWGLTKLTSTLQVDTSKVATRYYARTLPTSILSGQVAYSNGTNLGGDPDMTFISDQLILKPGYNTSNSILRAGSLEFSSYALNNSFFGDNIYYSGSSFTRRNTGFASLFYFYNDEGQFRLYPSGTGNVTVTGLDAQLKINRNGTFAVGSNIHETPGNYTGSKFLINSSGNVLIGTTTDVPTSILTARSSTKSSSPFPLHTLAESDAITGVQGNFDYETTQNGLRWYNGTRKSYALESTFARGTATRIPFFDANGQVTDNAYLNYNGFLYVRPTSGTTATRFTNDDTRGVDIDFSSGIDQPKIQTFGGISYLGIKSTNIVMDGVIYIGTNTGANTWITNTGLNMNQNGRTMLFNHGTSNNDGNTKAFRFVTDGSPSASTNFFEIVRGGTNLFTIKNNNILIGTTTDVATSILTARSTTKSSSPFPIHTTSESNAIIGVENNWDWETTQGLRGYNGTRKFYLPESTVPRFTSTYIPFADANGQLTQDASLTYNSTTDILSNTGAQTFNVSLYATNTSNTTTSSASVAAFNNTGRFALFGASSASYTGIPWIGGDAAFAYTNTTGGFSFVTENVSSAIKFSTDLTKYEAILSASGDFGIGDNISPARKLHVAGEARITDLTTDTPTRIVGADADGDLGALALSGLAINSGTLGIVADSLEKNSNVLYVSKNGNNSTAKRNNPRLSYLTIKAAVNASQKGDLIYIYPGTYNEGGNTLGRDSINFYCSPGAVVSNAVITDDYGGNDMDNNGYIRWMGSGVFDSCTVSIQHMNMKYHIEGDSMNMYFIPFWGIRNYNDVSLNFKFRSVKTINDQILFIPGTSTELVYTRLNILLDIDKVFTNYTARLYPLIHFGNGAGGTNIDAKAKFTDCSLIFNIKNIQINASNVDPSTPRFRGLVFGNGAVGGRTHFQRSNFVFNSDVINQSGITSSTYQTPFQGLGNSHMLFGLGGFKLDSSAMNFNVKSIVSDVHAFRIAEFWPGNKGSVNINVNAYTKSLATFHVIQLGSGAVGDSTLIINVDGDYKSDKEVVSCYNTPTIEKIRWQGNYTSFADKAVFAIKSDSFLIENAVLKNNGITADIYAAEAREIKVAGVYADGLNVSSNVVANWLDNIGNPKYFGYGTGAKEASDISKTQSNYVAGFATDGTVLDLEQKRDTTIYIDDADYDWSAAITTAQIARRFNRVIFWMTTTAAAGSDSDITLHTPDANLMQVEYLIHSVDEAGGFSNKIVFGTNNAVDSTNGLVTNYFPSAGDGIHIRAGLRSGVYKYRYSN